MLDEIAAYAAMTWFGTAMTWFGASMTKALFSLHQYAMLLFIPVAFFFGLALVV